MKAKLAEIRIVANGKATEIQTEVTENEYQFLIRLQNRISKASKNPDMPVMVISEIA